MPGAPQGLDEEEDRDDEGGERGQEPDEGAAAPSPGGELGAAVAAALQAALERTGEVPPTARPEPNGQAPPPVDHSQPLDLLDTSTAPWLRDPELGVQWAESWIASQPAEAEAEPPAKEPSAQAPFVQPPEVAELAPPPAARSSSASSPPEPAPPPVVERQVSPPPAESSPLPPRTRPYEPRSLEALFGAVATPASVPPPTARYVPSPVQAPVETPLERPMRHEPARTEAPGGWMRAVVAGLMLGMLAGLIAYAIGPATHDVYLARFVVPVNDLPVALEGLHLVQVSDLHLPRGADAATAAAQRVVEAKPEVLLLTGDLLDDASPEALAALDRFLGVAQGARGTFAILGERENGTALREALRSVYARHGVVVLSGDRATVAVGGAELVVHSLGDPSDKAPAIRPAAFTGGAAPARRRVDVWMVHAPQSVTEIPRSDLRNAAFVVAGHTLGGPLGLPTLVSASRYRAGWYSLDVTHLYVSNGVGTGRIPARLLAPAEVTRFTLRRATQPYATPERE